MRIENNVCQRCGGAKTFYYQVEFVLKGDRFLKTTETPVVPANQLRICSCSPERVAHDGNLDKDKYATVKIDEYPHVEIAVRGDEEAVYAEVVCLTVEQALSLRDWLIQETPTLEELAEG